MHFQININSVHFILIKSPVYIANKFQFLFTLLFFALYDKIPDQVIKREL